MRRWTLLVSLVVFALVGAACGGGDGGDPATAELTKEEQAFADAFAKGFTDETDGFGVSDTQGECLARVIMAELGTGPFEEAEVTPEDLEGEETPGQLLGDGAVSDEQADAIYTGWEDCADLDAVFADGFQREYDADEATRSCFEAGLAEHDLMRAYMVASFTSGEELDPAEPPLADMVEVITTCTGEGEQGEGGGSSDALVSSIADSLAAGGTITAAQAQCLAESIVDTVGAEELLAGGAEGDFTDASPELQQAVIAAITTAATACDVPLSQLGAG